MPTFTWDATFEAIPADGDLIAAGPDVIRDLKTATSEREELEHNFKTGTQPFHKGGKCSVLFIGTTTEINALTGMGGNAANNTFAWDTTLKVLKRYNGSAWAIMDIDHGALSGLTDDDHTRYLSLDKAGQNLVQSITVTALATIDGRDISVDGAALDTLVTDMAARPLNPFGAWLARAGTTIYLAATDGFVNAYSASGYWIKGWTDAATPPTTCRAYQGTADTKWPQSIMFPVIKGNYWKITVQSGTPTVYWLPIGS